jgi:hypothetical protein
MNGAGGYREQIDALVPLFRLVLEVCGKGPGTILVGVGTECIDLGEALSAAAQKGTKKALVQVQALGQSSV